MATSRPDNKRKSRKLLGVKPEGLAPRTEAKRRDCLKCRKSFVSINFICPKCTEENSTANLGRIDSNGMIHVPRKLW